MTLQYYITDYIANLEITEIINPQTGIGYTINRYLGEGGTGIVYEVTSGDEHRAMKLTTFIDDYRNELDVYDIISRDPNCNPLIVCLYDAFEIEFEVPVGVLIIELMANTLADVTVVDEEVPSFILDTLQAVVVLHEAGIAHGDIKDGNIYRNRLMMPGEPRFKLGDFSGSVINATPAQKRGDDQALATLFLELLYHVNAYTMGVPYFLHRELIYPRRESDIPSDAIETMIRGMLNPNVSERWSSEKALDYILSVIQ